jgi:peptide/nickel transport system substrate-binding protein
VTRPEASVGRSARVLIALAVAATLAGCGSSATTQVPTATAAPAGATAAPTTAPSQVESAAAQCQPGGTLVMARDDEPESLNPDMGTTNGTIFVQMQIFERLVEQAPAKTEPVPGVASSWEISPDGLTYTFHLRPDRKFSNGDPITAEDVKFSLDRFINDKVNVNYGFLAANIKDIEIVDPSTIGINMKAVDASILASLTLMSASILPQKIVTQLGEEKFGEKPIGSGPFMLKQWTRGQNLELVRNPNYWKVGQPYLDGVNFQLVTDDNARVLKAQSGEADVVQAIPIAQVDTIKNLSGYRLETARIFAQDNVWLNNTWNNNGTKPFADKLVRQALNYATPKEDLNNVVFKGVGKISNTMGSPTQYWDQSILPYPYDLEKAKQLMAQSTVPNGFTLPMMIASGVTNAQQTAELLKNEWAKIGVIVDIQPVDAAQFNTKFHSLDYASQLISAASVTSDTPDDSEMVSILFDNKAGFESFWTGYDNPAVTQLVHQAVAVTDPAKRKELYAQLQKLTMDDAPTVPLVLLPALTAVSNKVLGFQTLPAGHWLLQDVCFAR